MTNLENSTIAIQKSGRLTAGSLEWLNNNAGTDFPVSKEPFDKRRELTDKATGIVIAGYSNGDTLEAVACGQTDLGICGSDKYNELVAPYNQVRTWKTSYGTGGYYPENNPFNLEIRQAKLGFGMCRLALARPSGVLQKPIRSLATSYPKLATLYATDLEMRMVKIDKFAGGIEMICRRGGYDAVVDVVNEGATLLANDLVEVDTIDEFEAMLAGRKPASDNQDKQISAGMFEAAQLATRLDTIQIADGGRPTVPIDSRGTNPLLQTAQYGGSGALIYQSSRIGNR